MNGRLRSLRRPVRVLAGRALRQDDRQDDEQEHSQPLGPRPLSREHRGPGRRQAHPALDRPDRLQRCQIVADRLHTAIVQQNGELATLLAAYILKVMPQTARVIVDLEGNMQETVFAS